MAAEPDAGQEPVAEAGGSVASPIWKAQWLGQFWTPPISRDELLPVSRALRLLVGR